jgi:hypothetical protein
VAGGGSAIPITPTTPDMVHTVAPMRPRHSPIIAPLPLTALVEVFGGSLEGFFWEGVVGDTAEVSGASLEGLFLEVAVADVDDGSCCNEYSTLVDSYEEGGEARCQQEMELDPGEWAR